MESINLNGDKITQCNECSRVIVANKSGLCDVCLSIKNQTHCSRCNREIAVPKITRFHLCEACYSKKRKNKKKERKNLYRKLGRQKRAIRM